MLFQSTSHNRSIRRLHRSAAALLFLTIFPALAVAQSAKPSGPSSTTSPIDQPPAADAPSGSAGLLAEPAFVGQGFDLAEQFLGDGNEPSKNGFYPELSNMITGSGFVSAGPGYRHTVLGGAAFIDTSAAVSWHLYKMAQARFEFPKLADDHLAIGTQAMWQDNVQVSYYGIGSGSVIGDQAQYRLQSTEVAGYITARPASWLALGGEIGYLMRPMVLGTAGTFKPDYPDARTKYANDPAMGLDRQPNFLRSELSILADTLDSHSHPTSGGMYRGAMTVYSDESGGMYGFHRYEVEGVQMAPLGSRKVLLGVRAWTVYSDVPAGHQVPFYLMPGLGGNNTLRGFDDYQFHDLNTVVASAELRFAVLAHVDVAAFYDAGNVAARYADLNFDKRSIGAGLRVHANRTTFGRLDVAHGDEGWRLVVRTSEPFKLSHVARKLASIPFMP